MIAHIVTAAWMLSTTLFYLGVAVGFTGVAIFGWYFIGANARAAHARGSDTMVWGGAGAMQGRNIALGGLLLHIAGYVLGMVLSGLA